MSSDPRIIKHDPVPDTTHDPYFTTEKQVDAAHFWWNHLTYAQRCFILERIEGDFRHTSVPTEAYKTSADWKLMEGWPE